MRSAVHEHIQLRAYDAAWPSAFALERGRLLSLFPGQFIDIQHIGSTAVPGLAAKPIIDLLAGVASMAVARALPEALCGAGYTTSQAFNDSLPDRQWFMRWRDGRRTHHLHVVVFEANVWTEWLQLRDALRAQPELAARYAALKAELAARYPNDREAYTQAKGRFIRAVLEDAPPLCPVGGAGLPLAGRATLPGQRPALTAGMIFCTSSLTTWPRRWLSAEAVEVAATTNSRASWTQISWPP